MKTSKLAAHPAVTPVVLVRVHTLRMSRRTTG